MSEERISGTLAAAVTPLRDAGERLDEDAFGALFDFYGAGGLQGLLVLGTTGEGIMLDLDERRRAAELAVSMAGSMQILVHCGAQTTAATRELAAHAAEVGAAGVAVIAPPYFPFNSSELVEHFAAAAAACAPLPFYIYEYAERSGYAVAPAVVRRVRERSPNLVGMKVSDAPYDRVEPYLKLGLDVFVGAESVIMDGLENGAVGAVSGVAGAFPEVVSALVREPTVERSKLVESLRSALSERPFQASVKVALGLRGLPVRPDVRAPLQPLGPASTDHLGAELRRLLGVETLSRPVLA